MILDDVPVKILVGSGKGGVGKTTVASDIARCARDKGYTAGLIDADISTPNTPEVVSDGDADVSDQRLSDGTSLRAPIVEGVQLVSQGMVLPDNVPVLRGGEWRAESVVDYVRNVEWEPGTDVVVIDSPPGHGEEIQVVASDVDLDHAFVVTTPHESSVDDANRTVSFFEEAGLPHTAIVNMAYVPGDDMVDWVMRKGDFDDINGVGEKTVESISEMLYDTVPDYPLFGYDPDDEVPITANVDATVPYTTAYGLRKAAINDAVADLLDAMEVTA